MQLLYLVNPLKYSFAWLNVEILDEEEIFLTNQKWANKKTRTLIG